MLFLDHTQVQYCKLRVKDKTVSGIIYSDKIFVRVKAFPKEELEVAIKECREEYLDHEQRSKIPTLLVKGKSSIGIWMANKRYKKQDIIETSDKNDSSSAPQASTSKSAAAKDSSGRLDLRKLCAKMRSADIGVEVKTRRHKLKLFQRCFIGNEAVDWIVEQTKVSRPKAVKIGQTMLEKGFFHHVLDEHQFKDENLFYRFNADEGRSIWNSTTK